MKRFIFLICALIVISINSSAITSPDLARQLPVASIVTFLLFDRSPPYDISMIEPYRNQRKIASINEAYSENGAIPLPPWAAHPHDGIDFMPTENLIEIQSVAHGTVSTVEKYGSNGQITVIVRYNEKYAVNYAFEPGQGAYSDMQLAEIVVVKGQQLTPGDLIGRLVKPALDTQGAHLHFGLIIDHVQKCPATYFTTAARESVLRILQQLYPAADICYLAD